MIKLSSTDQDTLSPSWNQALIDAKASDIMLSLSLDVWDDDFIGDDLMASCSVTVSEAELLADQMSVTCGPAQITLSFFAL